MTHRRDRHDADTGTGSQAFAAGLLWGVAIGAAVALLVAPKSGAELRGQMSESADRVKRRARAGYDRARETYDQAGETVEDVSGRVRDMASDFADRATELGGRFGSTSSRVS